MGFKTSFGLVNLSIMFDDNIGLIDKNYIENSLKLKIKDMDELYNKLIEARDDSEITYE